ncbi:TonB-dependent receptor [Phocaeicola sp.]
MDNIMKCTPFGEQKSLWSRKTLLIMKFFVLFLLLGTIPCLAGVAYSQNVKMSLNMENTTVHDVIAAIEKQGDFYFTYNLNQINVNRKVSIKVENKTVNQILDQLFSEYGIDYKIENRHIVLYKKAAEGVTAVKQQKTIQGTIVDDQGEPIIGASVLEKGTTNGTITDFDGHFSLHISSGTELIVSYVGYTTKTVKIGNQSIIKIVLVEDTKTLDEVVVIGYGTQKKSDVSGSVTTVSGEKLTKMPTANAEAALQGMAPGLSVNFGSGAPGTAATLQVRGITTWGTDNSPLVIIDGVPGDMSYLNPEDIKSMSVLKDAATAAIYGARAAAGVILIETHRGGMQAPKIQFSAYVGMDDLPKRMEVCNSAEFIQVRKMALSNAGYSPEEWPRYIAAYEKDPSQFADTDWQDEYYRRALTQKYTIGYTAGNEIMNVALSGFYSGTDGIVIGTDEKKYGFRLNSDVTRGKFKMGESISYSRWEATPEVDTGFPGMFQTTNIEPLVSVYDERNEGGFGGAIAGMDMSDAANPVAFNKLIRTDSANDYLSASGYIQYEPIKNLIFKFRASRSIYWGSYKQFIPTYEVGVLKKNTKASLYEQRKKTMNDLMEFTANWDKSFKDHNIQALFGLSQEENKYDDLSATGKKFENNDMDLMGHAQQDFSAGGAFTRSGLRSVFGRVSYNYKYRYMIMASCRYDGSSRFADGNKWGFFPSVSLGWNIANEDFWENLKETVSTFKLRLSYGGLGNQSIGVYKYIPTLNSDATSLNYALNGKDISLGYGITGLPSANIKWETTIYKNIGIDLGLWNNKLELSAEAYIKDTRDMLSSKNISLCTGFGSLVVNDGKLRTTGFEMQAIYHGRVGGVKYDLDMNLSHYKSVLKAMADPNYQYEYGPARTYVGGEIGEFWVLRTAGIFQSQAEVDEWNKAHGHEDKNGNWIPLQPSAKPGDIRFIDQNGDGLLDSGDKEKVGSGNPKVVLGFNVNLAYKNFDLVANFYGNFGVKRYNYMKLQLQRMDKNFNYGKDALKAWTPGNPNTDVPRAVQGDPNKNNAVSDRFVENGNFLRLNNLQIGYNLPNRACKQLGIANLRLYIGGSRLFTITSYKGYDPAVGAEAGKMGADYALYPLSRSYMVGLKFGF